MDPATVTALNAVVIEDAMGALPMWMQAVVLTLLVATGFWVAWRPSGAGVVAFVACALVWARADQRLEGAILITVAPGRGLTVADLVAPALTAWILTQVARIRRIARGQAPSRRKARVGQAATVRRACSSSVSGTAPSAIIG